MSFGKRWRGLVQSISISNDPHSPSTEIFLTLDRPSTINNISPLSFLPRCVSKNIKDTSLDVGDIYLGRQNCSLKKHVNIALMTHVLENFDPIT